MGQRTVVFVWVSRLFILRLLLNMDHDYGVILKMRLALVWMVLLHQWTKQFLKFMFLQLLLMVVLWVEQLKTLMTRLLWMMSGVLRMFPHITLQRIFMQISWKILLSLRWSIQNLKKEKDPKVLFLSKTNFLLLILMWISWSLWWPCFVLVCGCGSYSFILFSVSCWYRYKWCWRCFLYWFLWPTRFLKT